MDFLENVIDASANISVITEIEALSWTSADKNQEKIVSDFIGDSNVFYLTDDIVKLCVRIRRSRRIKIPDAIIAATAIIADLTLLTSDKGFHRIDKLKIVDPALL